jgi:pimeloyl-ACP methyl ester carboxylesterase
VIAHVGGPLEADSFDPHLQERRRLVGRAQHDAYLVLLRRTDHGRAFLKIMRGFELTRVKRDLYVGLLRSRAFPVQIIWGEADPALKVTTFGEIARRAAGVDQIHRLPGGSDPPATRQTFPARRSVAGAGRVDHRAGPAVISCPKRAAESCSIFAVGLWHTIRASAADLADGS